MPLTLRPEYGYRGLGQTIGRYTVLIVGDQLLISVGDEEVLDRRISTLGMFLLSARDLRMGWGVLPNGAEVLVLYDRANHNFGYGVEARPNGHGNWGYAPFPCQICPGTSCERR